MANRYRRFRDISTSERILDTLFLLTIGLGYLFALSHLYFSHSARDGQPGLSINDVMIAYYGSHDHSRLGAAINGPMEPNLNSKADKFVILKWLQNGKSKDQFEQLVAPILNRDCITCHSSDENPGMPNLTTYEGVLEVADAKGASLPSLVKVSHIHLFGIAFILFFTGKIFILTDINSTLKRTIVAIPFIAMVIDILSWYVTTIIPGFAYVVVISGAFLGLSMGTQILISLYQMWFYPFHPSLQIPVEIQERIASCHDLLEEFGYQMFPEENGWLVKESLRTWVFLHDVNELEEYVEDVRSRHLTD
ncbi:hypothetical protein [Methyloprofundus sedimenti]|uniref:hypothetical protein n=1 Tax=Methyloprofundus sedimenti TaxID=1420851 RepID=UPI001E2A190E|nr:hypothetical protein [Methyloprofundus sedimenti]